MQLTMAVHEGSGEVSKDKLVSIIEFITRERDTLNELIGPLEPGEQVGVLVLRPRNDPEKPLIGLTFKSEEMPNIVGLLAFLGALDAPVVDVGIALMRLVGIDSHYVAVVARRDADGTEIVDATTNLPYPIEDLIGMRFEVDEFFEVLGGATISA